MSTEQKTGPPREHAALGRALPRRATAWTVLIAAGLLEIVWSLALKEAGGLERPAWAAGGIALALLSLAMLAYALKSLPVGTAYAVWVGIGAVGVAAAGMLLLQEPATWPRLAFLALIVAGVIGLNLTERPEEHSDGADRVGPAARNGAES